MSVVAKFFVQEITRRASAPDAAEVTLAVVSRGEENKSWSRYTPSGQIKMGIMNAAAAEQFVLGQEFMVTFEPVAP
jgi:hypothetical protein